MVFILDDLWCDSAVEIVTELAKASSLPIYAVESNISELPSEMSDFPNIQLRKFSVAIILV